VLPLEDTDPKRHKRVVPVPPSMAELIERMLPRSDTPLLYSTPSGRKWTRSNFHRDVWTAARRATGMDPRPHEFRHSYVPQLRAAGVADADLADIAGHRVETMLSTYTHPLRRSHERVREIIG
jgi:integrase